jgi:hypothetical protein
MEFNAMTAGWIRQSGGRVELGVDAVLYFISPHRIKVTRERGMGKQENRTSGAGGVVVPAEHPTDR